LEETQEKTTFEEAEAKHFKNHIVTKSLIPKSSEEKLKCSGQTAYEPVCWTQGRTVQYPLLVLQKGEERSPVLNKVMYVHSQCETICGASVKERG